MPSTHACFLGDIWAFLLFGPAKPRGASSSVYDSRDDERTEPEPDSTEPGVPCNVLDVEASGVRGEFDSPLVRLSLRMAKFDSEKEGEAGRLADGVV